MEIGAILAKLEGKVSLEELAALEAALRDARNRGERHWLEDVFEAAEFLPLPEVPPLVTRELKALARPAAALAIHEAELVRDTRIDRSLAGVRGGVHDSGWSLTYASEVADLLIDVWPLESGELALEGQLLPHAELAGAVRATAGGRTTETVGGDELGRFRFDALAADEYRLSVDDGVIAVVATVALRGPS